MKIAIAQMNSNDFIADNLKQIENLIVAASKNKAQLVVFPENSLFFRISTTASVQSVDINSKEIQHLKDVCQKNAVAIYFTSAIKENGHVYNATVYVDTEQNAKVVYRKIHLFDIELVGEKPIRESDVFVRGKSTAIEELGGLKIGHSICYDIRFSNLYSKYAEAEVDLISVPAAFLVKTGQAHWESLLRARAIESQCYVIAPAQAGVHRSSDSSVSVTRETYGHTMIIGPWGEIISMTTDQQIGLTFFDLDKQQINKVRTQIPMKNHRRFDF